MSVVSWPSGVPNCIIPYGVSGGHQDNRASFQPDVGAPIERARTTAVPEIFDVTLSPMSKATYAKWKTWFEQTAKFGSLPFAWRHPISGDVKRARILKNDPPYSVRRRGKSVDVGFSVMCLPGTPWWAPYVLSGAAQVPYVVADYTNSVFGVDGAIATGADVATVSGTFDVYTTHDDDSVTIELNHAVSAGDIPATAPADTKKIVAFT